MASSSSTAPQVPPRESACAGGATTVMDENIARLMAMGYSFNDVNRALVVAKNDINIAIQILSNFVRSVT